MPRWSGRDAIRERYVVLGLPRQPHQRQARRTSSWTSKATGPTAVSTTVIGNEVAPGGDRWTFAKQDGRWWITGLTYNLEAR